MLFERRIPERFFEKVLNAKTPEEYDDIMNDIQDWLHKQNLLKGEEIIIPDPRTGEHMIVEYDPFRRIH